MHDQQNIKEQYLLTSQVPVQLLEINGPFNGCQESFSQDLLDV
jgi:hypothetical protein